jgi:hypothetical protein
MIQIASAVVDYLAPLPKAHFLKFFAVAARLLVLQQHYARPFRWAHALLPLVVSH